MTERDPKTAAAPRPTKRPSPAPDPVVHRVLESERSLAARARSSNPPPVAPADASAQPVPRSTLRMFRPDVPEGDGSVAPPPAAAPPPAVQPPAHVPFGSSTLIMVAPIRANPPPAPAPVPHAPPPGSAPSPAAPAPARATLNTPPSFAHAPAPPHAHALVHVPRDASRVPAPGISPARARLLSGATSVDPRLILVTEPESARAVAFRLLRDNLLSKALPRVLVVAGAAPQDGTTTCAANVALALAELPESRVLLMDADFASPSLARMFAVDGFGPIDEAIAPLKLVALTPRFQVAAIVRRSADATPRFDKVGYQRALDHLGAEPHDYIVIDAGALRPGSAAAQLVTVAEATLLAVRAGRTTARALRRASSQIPPGRAIGVTLVDDESTHD